MDPRVESLADLLVNYSLKVQPGWQVAVEGTTEVAPLLLALQSKVLAAGGHPRVSVSLEEAGRQLMAEGSDEQLDHLSPVDTHIADTMDARVRVMGAGNTRLMAGIPGAKMARRRQATSPLLATTMKRTAAGDFTWVGTLYPTQAQAQEAGMSLADYEEFVFGAGMLNLPDPTEFWRRLGAEQEKIVEVLNAGKEFRATAADTDLSMSVEGRTWISCAGELNFPDGEVFTAPVEGSVEGHIRYQTPTLYGGVLVRDIRLKFAGGKVVDASAAEGEEHLHSLLDMDDGARVPGEIAIGTNYGIQRHTLNILFDEKIGGTMHMALGAGYPQTGAKNKSALHWDMILDMRQGGSISLDGSTIHQDGRFTIPGVNLPGAPA